MKQRTIKEIRDTTIIIVVSVIISLIIALHFNKPSNSSSDNAIREGGRRNFSY